MTTIAESATITVTKETTERLRTLTEAVVAAFEALTEVIAQAARAFTEIVTAVTDFFADLDRKANGRPRWMVLQDEKFAHRGTLSTLPVRGVSPR